MTDALSETLCRSAPAGNAALKWPWLGLTSGVVRPKAVKKPSQWRRPVAGRAARKRPWGTGNGSGNSESVEQGLVKCVAHGQPRWTICRQLGWKSCCKHNCEHSREGEQQHMSRVAGFPGCHQHLTTLGLVSRPAPSLRRTITGSRSTGSLLPVKVTGSIK